MIISERQLQFLMTIAHQFMCCEHFNMRNREAVASLIDEIRNQQSTELREVKE